MSVREYIGARYVPLFADPLTWDATRTYEPLTVVLYQGNSYTSRQAVPANIDITNTTYWAQTGNYNAQIEQYRAEVQTFDGRIEDNADAISDEETARQNADSALQTAIDNEVTARQNADALLATKVELQTAIANVPTVATIDSRIRDYSIKGVSLSGAKSIGFGDSNMAATEVGPENGVYRKICDMLGCTYDNRGVNGAQINPLASNSIATQVNNATADSDVRLVVLIGGINDIHYSGNTAVEFRNSCSSLLTTITNKFPNAIVVTIFDAGMQFPSSNYLRFVDGLKIAGISFNTNRILNVPTADLAFAPSSYFGSQNHWNSTGCLYVARRAINILQSMEIKEYLKFRETVNGITELNGTTNLCVNKCEYDYANNSIHHDLHLEIVNCSGTADIAAYTTLFTVKGGFSGAMKGGEYVTDFTCVASTSPADVQKTVVLNFVQTAENYAGTTFDDSVIAIRTRTPFNARDLQYKYLNLHYSYTQIPWS